MEDDCQAVIRLAKQLDLTGRREEDAAQNQRCIESK
jgi:hypothetical protein